VARCEFAAAGELPESVELVADVKGKSEQRETGEGDREDRN
jgi:hypothetical protein